MVSASVRTGHQAGSVGHKTGAHTSFGKAYDACPGDVVRWMVPIIPSVASAFFRRMSEKCFIPLRRNCAALIRHWLGGGAGSRYLHRSHLSDSSSSASTSRQIPRYSSVAGPPRHRRYLQGQRNRRVIVRDQTPVSPSQSPPSIRILHNTRMNHKCYPPRRRQRAYPITRGDGIGPESGIPVQSAGIPIKSPVPEPVRFGASSSVPSAVTFLLEYQSLQRPCTCFRRKARWCWSMPVHRSGRLQPQRRWGHGGPCRRCSHEPPLCTHRLQAL